MGPLLPLGVDRRATRPRTPRLRGRPARRTGATRRLTSLSATERGAEIGRDPQASGDEIDVRGLLVVPGLIDLHTHVYRGRTSLVQSNGARPEIKFALDSPVEERRFEPSVPP